MNALYSDSWNAGIGENQVAVLLLHGYGSHAGDLAALGDRVAPGLPWAALQAPLGIGPGMRAWFPISVPGNPDPQPVAQATDAIWEWVEQNIPDSVAVLPLGFSQGGLMATQLLRTRPERVAGTVILGGFVQAAPQPGDTRLAAERPPVFWGRGSADTVITAEAVQRTKTWLAAHAELTERIYPGIGHQINAAEAADAAAYLLKQAAARQPVTGE